MYPGHADADPPNRSCGKVKGKGYSLKVRAERVSCRTARRVVRYVSTHGEPTQGTPGKAPKGWHCAWTYGESRYGIGRAGPACGSGGGKRANGYGPGYKPA